MKISQILEIPTVRILLFLYHKGEVRHTELAKTVTSRGTLSLSLKELEAEGIIRRKIVATKPIQSFYSLTEKGKEIAKRLDDIKNIGK